MGPGHPSRSSPAGERKTDGQGHGDKGSPPALLQLEADRSQAENDAGARADFEMSPDGGFFMRPGCLTHEGHFVCADTEGIKMTDRGVLRVPRLKLSDRPNRRHNLAFGRAYEIL